jgi:hypothetical protein
LRGRKQEEREELEMKSYKEEVGIQNLLIELEKKQLQWFGQVKRMDGKRIAQRAFELKFKGESLMGGPRKKWCSQVLQEDYYKTPRREEIAGKNLNRKDCGKIKEIGDFCPLTHIKQVC